LIWPISSSVSVPVYEDASIQYTDKKGTCTIEILEKGKKMHDDEIEENFGVCDLNNIN
jgi:uncharacterized ubiquitin-like protein YukD